MKAEEISTRLHNDDALRDEVAEFIRKRSMEDRPAPEAANKAAQFFFEGSAAPGERVKLFNVIGHSLPGTIVSMFDNGFAVVRGNGTYYGAVNVDLAWESNLSDDEIERFAS